MTSFYQTFVILCIFGVAQPVFHQISWEEKRRVINARAGSLHTDDETHHPHVDHFLQYHHDPGEGKVVANGMCVNETEIHKSLGTVRCSRPSLQTVKLRVPGPNYIITPSVATVKRCSGHCSHPQGCLPLRTSTVLVAVYQKDKTRPHEPPTCTIYELEEHLECGCTCGWRKHHCSVKQQYDSHNCACFCKNEKERLECLERASKPELFSAEYYWDGEKCECKCAQESCGPRQVWDFEQCRCKPKMELPIAFDHNNDFIF